MVDVNISVCVSLMHVLRKQHRICFGILDIQSHVRMNKEVAVMVGKKVKFKRFKKYDTVGLYTHFIRLSGIFLIFLLFFFFILLTLSGNRTLFITA